MSNPRLLGIDIDDLSLDEVLARLTSAVSRQQRPPLSVCYVNAESLLRAHGDEAVRSALSALDLRCPDGISVTMASQLYGRPVRHRYSGIDTLTRTLAVDRPLRHFFMGSTDATLSRIRERVERDYPRHEVVGVYTPPMWPWGKTVDEQILREVARTGPDFLWVGLSAPKQELWIAQHRTRIQASATLAIGYAFDTFAGVKPLASPWVRRFGLEWLHRLIRHPQHTWRRVFVSGPRYAWAVLTDKDRRDPERRS